MSDRIEIGDATLKDIPACSELLGALFTQEADFTPDIKKQSRALKLILENSAIGKIYCAKKDGSVIGMVSILFTVSTAEGGLAAWLEDLVIEPAYRNKGLGHRLVKEANKGAREAGCSRMTVLTDATNSGALRFYERHGFSRSQMIPLRLVLGE